MRTPRVLNDQIERDHGFSILEVLIATLIVAVAILATIAFQDSVVRVTGSSNDLMQGAFLAQTYLAPYQNLTTGADLRAKMSLREGTVSAGFQRINLGLLRGELGLQGANTNTDFILERSVGDQTIDGVDITTVAVNVYHEVGQVKHFRSGQKIVQDGKEYRLVHSMSIWKPRS